MTIGIDVSSYQSVSEYKALIPSLGFAAIKATEGTWHDPDYAMHVQALSGVPVLIAYHFGSRLVSGSQQAAEFLATAKGVTAYALDIEGGTHNISEAEGRAFILAVKRAVGKCGLYGSESGFPNWGQDWNWVANYSREPAIAYDIWQYGPAAPNVDGDRSRLSVAQLASRLEATSASSLQEPLLILSVIDKIEDWTPNGLNGVFRATPDRAAAVVARVAAGTVVTTTGEITTNDPANPNWRKTRRNGQTLFMLRSDWVPVTQGGDPKVDALLETILAPRPADTTPFSQADVNNAVNAAKAQLIATNDAQAAQIKTLEARVVRSKDLAKQIELV